MILALLLAFATTTPSALPDDAVIALIMVDRFADGAPNGPDVVQGGLRRFQGGDLTGVRVKLPYLQALGVTHLWLTPLHQQVADVEGTAPYHGYWPQQLDAVDPHFGSLADLQALVRDAATMQIGVVLDVVTNHFGYGASDPLQLVRKQCGDDETTSCLFGLPDLATEEERIQAVVVDKTLWWVRQAPIAGFRIDAFKHVDRQTSSAIRQGARALRPGFFTLAEQWGTGPGDAVVDDIISSGAADAVFDFGLMGLARDFVKGRMRSAAFAHHLVERDAVAAGGPPMLPFLDNHDTETWTHAVGSSRSPIGAALLLTNRGVPVVTWGTELQREGGPQDPENRTFMPWERASSSSSLTFWSRLIQLRRSSPATRAGALRIRALDVADAPRFVVYDRQHGRQRVVVAVALDRALRHLEPLARDTQIDDVIAWHGSAARKDGSLVIDVEKDGAVVVVLRERPVSREVP
ncbi:MAG: alpha-amylase family glycosyl hydrolase [Deltaproteobacteria bacterium]|nr:alpha-amylase family glycosyl hydrolase [Deltaproteobacteria bacterium]